MAYLKTRFCADSYEYSLLWRLQHLRVERGQFPLFHSTFVTGVSLLEGSKIVTESHLAYYYLQGLEHDMQAKLLPKKLIKLAEMYQEAWDFFRKPRTNPTVIMVAGKKGRASAIPVGGPMGMDLDSVQVDPRSFLTEVTGTNGRMPIFATTTPANLFTTSVSPTANLETSTGQTVAQPLFAKNTLLVRPVSAETVTTTPAANAANMQSQGRGHGSDFGRGNVRGFNVGRGQGRSNFVSGRSNNKGRPTGPVRRSASSDDRYRTRVDNAFPKTESTPQTMAAVARGCLLCGATDHFILTCPHNRDSSWLHGGRGAGPSPAVTVASTSSGTQRKIPN